MNSSLQKRMLLVDGNFFAHRTLHGYRISHPDFNLETTQDMFNFEVMLNNSLQTLYNSMNNNHHNLIDNIIFVFDNNSWRKNVRYLRDEINIESGETEKINDYFKPYYIDDMDMSPLGYKENRKEDKEKSDINYNNFNICLNNFRTKISENIACIYFNGGEGDDGLLLLTKELAEANIESIIFCTDGDLKSLVNKNVIVFRSVKSNECPNGEFIISNYLINKLYSEKTALEHFTQLNIETDYYHTLFNVDFYNGGQTKSSIIRKFNDGVNRNTANINLLNKIICGDKKDNIFPILRWKNSTGNGIKNVTPLMVKKAFEMSLYDFDENSVKDAFFNSKIMIEILQNLKVITKQTKIDIKIIANHFNHNLKMNKLHIDILPKEVIDNFYENFNNNKTLVFRDIELSDLLKINIQQNQNDSAKSLLINSLPDEKNSLVNDILNS